MNNGEEIILQEFRDGGYFGKGGKTGTKVRSKASWNRDRMFTSQQPHEQAYKKKRKSAIRDHKKDASRESQEPHEIASRKAKSWLFKSGGKVKTDLIHANVLKVIEQKSYYELMKQLSLLNKEMKAGLLVGEKYEQERDYIRLMMNKRSIERQEKEFNLDLNNEKRKTVTLHFVQGNYGQGWEDLTAHESLSSAKAEMKVYDENERTPHRVKTKRVSKIDFRKGNYETGGAIPEHMGASDLKTFAKGGEIEPAIYLADLGAYNEGKLIGEWIKLNDFDDASELMEHIQEIVEKWSKEQGVEREEYAVHDYEYLPSSIAGEYMGERDFEKYYEIKEASSDSGLPLDVVLEWMSVTGSDDPSRIEDAYIGQYDNAKDMAEQYVDEGIMQPSSHDVYITDTDRRIISGEMSDNYASDIRSESSERVIEEAEMSLEEYEDADEERQEEMVDEAEETVRDRYYDEIYEALDDPYYYFVEEQGMYSPEDFFKASFVSIDYEKVGQELDWDHTFIDGEDGEHYTFTNNYKKGGKIDKSESFSSKVYAKAKKLGLNDSTWSVYPPQKDIPTGSIFYRVQGGANYVINGSIFLDDSLVKTPADFKRESLALGRFRKGGKVRSKASWNRDRMFTSQQPHEQAYKKKRKSAIRDHKKDAGLKSQEAHEIASRKKARAKRLATGGALESFYPEREMNVDFAKGGLIYEIHSKHSDSDEPYEYDNNLQSWSTYKPAKATADQLNKDSNGRFKYKVVKKMATGGKITKSHDIKLDEAIKFFEEKIRKQGSITNARDEEHLERLKAFKKAGLT
jgi:antirestriction protein